jgi:hypothetical protein
VPDGHYQFERLMAIINLNDSSPAAPAGRRNIKWQADSSAPRNVSAFVAPSYHTVTWGIGIGGPVATGASVTPLYVLPVRGMLVQVTAIAKTAPAGADLIVDLLADGTSLLPAGHLHLLDGQTQADSTSFASSPQAVAAGQVLSLDVLQVGSTTAGKDVTVQLLIEL